MATRSQCTVCGQMFTSVAAFDWHRTGQFEKKTRRCLTPQEMQKHKMVQNSRGEWMTPQTDRTPWVRTDGPLPKQKPA